MTTELIITQSTSLVPTQITTAGESAAKRFLEFFTANIRNPNTRSAYYRGVLDFFRWTERRGLVRLEAIEPIHVAAYIEELAKTHASKRQAEPGRCADAV